MTFRRACRAIQAQPIHSHHGVFDIKHGLFYAARQRLVYPLLSVAMIAQGLRATRVVGFMAFKSPRHHFLRLYEDPVLT